MTIQMTLGKNRILNWKVICIDYKVQNPFHVSFLSKILRTMEVAPKKYVLVILKLYFHKNTLVTNSLRYISTQT